MNHESTNGKAGFTLKEITIAVVIVALFAAAVSPMILHRLADARLDRAQDECETIANAVLNYYRDTGTWPSNNGTAGAEIARMVSSARVATGAGAGAGTGAFKWGSEGATRPMGDYLYKNKPDNSAEATDQGNWRGPYIDQHSFDDPWGKAYVVNTHYAPGGGYSGKVHHSVFVLSAGPNGKWETAWDDATSEEILGDDIGTVITMR